MVGTESSPPPEVHPLLGSVPWTEALGLEGASPPNVLSQADRLVREVGRRIAAFRAQFPGGCPGMTG
jgi:hypothetical protein